MTLEMAAKDNPKGREGLTNAWQGVRGPRLEHNTGIHCTKLPIAEEETDFQNDGAELCCRAPTCK